LEIQHLGAEFTAAGTAPGFNGIPFLLPVQKKTGNHRVSDAKLSRKIAFPNYIS
jgi:hypothetical protein